MDKSKQPRVASSANKKHLARQERERRQTQAIFWIALVVLLSVIGLIGYGILNQTVFLERQPVAVVNGDKITTREFQMQVRLERQRLINQYIQMAQYAQYFGFDPTTQLQQIQSQLGLPVQIGQTVLDAMIEQKLVRQEAARRGMIVSAEDIEAEIRNFFGFFPDGTPTPEPTPTVMAASTLSPEQLRMVTPTAIPTLEPTATLDPAIPTNTPGPTATPGPTGTPEPTATPYTAEGYQTTYQDLLNNYKDIGMTEADFRSFFEYQLIYQKLFDEVNADLKPVEEQVWARHILVADEATALLVRERLLAGEDFGALAAEFSQDTSNKDNGGDLGWFSRNMMVAEFETVAYTLPVGEISPPVKTSFGWHLIQVIAHEDRPMDATKFDELKQSQFDAFVAELKAQADITTYDSWMQNVPTDPTLEEALQAAPQ